MFLEVTQPNRPHPIGIRFRHTKMTAIICREKIPRTLTTCSIHYLPNGNVADRINTGIAYWANPAIVAECKRWIAPSKRQEERNKILPMWENAAHMKESAERILNSYTDDQVATTKDHARRISLKAVLERCFCTLNNDKKWVQNGAEAPFTKEERLIIWDAYISKCLAPIRVRQISNEIRRLRKNLAEWQIYAIPAVQSTDKGKLLIFPSEVGPDAIHDGVVMNDALGG